MMVWTALTDRHKKYITDINRKTEK
jgi:hypothetical protein